jgi:hypothetical protein
MKIIAVFTWAAATTFVAAATAHAQAQAQDPAPAADAAPTVNAVWVEREILFTYMGVTAYYSCDGLRDKLRLILPKLGARPGFKLTTRSCVNMTGPEWAPAVQIVAQFPAEATPELLAELADSAPERELAARAGGRSATEATAQFPARWRRVVFTSGPLEDIENGDCELMEQLRKRVFDRIGVRVVDYNVTCMPHQVSLGAVRMTVEVLEPVPQAPPVQ